MLIIRRPTEHDESVYKLVEKPQVPPPKPPRHTSKYARQVREEAERRILGAHKTMGFATTPLDLPKLYLRKHTRSAISLHPRPVSKQPVYQLGVQTFGLGKERPSTSGGAAAKKEPASEAPPSPEEVTAPEPAPKRADWVSATPHRRRHCPHDPKPRVPSTCCSRFRVLERGPKDFVMDNTVSALREPPKIPVPRYVDTPKGNTRDWCKSGLARVYVMRSDYGSVPEYLVERKKELKAKEEAEKYKEEEARRKALEKCRHLTEEERQKLISGLKRRWNDVYNDFQSFPLVVDRPLGVKLKAELERKLKEIERDIDFVERHNHIFVSDAPRTFYLH